MQASHGPGTTDLAAPGITLGLGRVPRRLPEPNQSEGDGLASDLTRSVSRSRANTGRVTRPASYPTPVELVGRRWGYGQRIPPNMRGSNGGRFPASRRPVSRHIPDVLPPTTIVRCRTSGPVGAFGTGRLRW